MCICGRSSRRPGGTGAKLVVIDPYRTRTAALADEHLAINPGTDAALALGMMHVILNMGLEDREYIARCTTGFEELKAHALGSELFAGEGRGSYGDLC